LRYGQLRFFDFNDISERNFDASRYDIRCIVLQFQSVDHTDDIRCYSDTFIELINRKHLECIDAIRRRLPVVVFAVPGIRLLTGIYGPGFHSPNELSGFVIHMDIDSLGIVLQLKVDRINNSFINLSLIADSSDFLSDKGNRLRIIHG